LPSFVMTIFASAIISTGFPSELLSTAKIKSPVP
jgi:hypothetical protein